MIAALALVAGCDRLFGIQHFSADDDFDAALPDSFDPSADRDSDGIPDAVDNCPDTPNDDQADFDQDQIGDICDLCPLDRDDQTDTDGDRIGDACDPNPGAIDCLILVDTFGDPTTFASHWRVVADIGDATHVMFGPKPTITAAAGKFQEMYAVDGASILAGPHDVEVIGQADLAEDSGVFATTFAGVTSPRFGGLCGVRRNPQASGGISNGVNAAHNGGAVSESSFAAYGTVFANQVAMTLYTDQLPMAGCSVTVGNVMSDATVPIWQNAPPLTGGSGITVLNTSFGVDAVAFYRQRRTAETCPTPIRR